MAREPERVELYEDGVRKLTLRESHPQSLNNKKPYTGRADFVRIFGKAGSIVTFFDDQEFRDGENAVLIEKLTDEPIEVPIGRNFVRSKEEAGDGVYYGNGPGTPPKYRWTLFKSVKKDWLRRASPIDIDKLVKAAEGTGDPRAVVGAKFVRALQAFGIGDTTSSNYRVDNCSSVRFGL